MFAPVTEYISPALLLVAFIAVIHAAFQVATSVLTLLSGHSLIRSKAHKRIASLNLSYIAGVGFTTYLLLSTLTFALTLWASYDIVDTLWVLVIGALVTIGFLIILFYYRSDKGTQLWLPRGVASYLESRSKKTKNAVEALALGVMSALAELPLTAVLFVTTALIVASTMAVDDYTLVLSLYSLTVAIPLLLIAALLASGHKLSHIQRWRETNKLFLQYVSGIGFIITAIFVWVQFVLGAAS